METAVCNLAAVGRLLNKACHPGTPDTEALIFARHAYKICDQGGVSLPNAIQVKKGSPEYAALSTMPRQAYVDNAAAMTLTIAERDAEIARLKKAMAEKDGKIANLEAAPADNVKIAELEATCASQAAQIAELRSHLGATQERLRETGAQRDPTRRHPKVDVREAFDVQSNDAKNVETEYNVHADVVDEQVGTELVKDFGSGAAPAASVAPELVWTDLVKAKLAKYAKKGVSAVMIGRRLAREFGVRVTSSTVAAMLRSLLTADADGFLWASHWR